MTNKLLQSDRVRQPDVPKFQRLLRRTQSAKFFPIKLMYWILYRCSARRSHIEISPNTQIGEGLFLGHAYGITINTKAIVGRNCNIHKGVTIGQENRGKRKGTPVIGDCVWIGINSTVVGNIRIGNDVLIAPNSYVNCDVPDHSIVIGNPCIIKPRENATEGYINNKV